MYLVMELQKNKDGHVANIVTEHETLALAESKYHMVLSAAAVSGIPVHSAIILSDEGFPMEHRRWKHEQDNAV